MNARGALRRGNTLETADARPSSPIATGDSVDRMTARGAVPGKAFLNEPVDIASLAAFRVLFGLVMAFSVLRFVAKGWVRTFLLAPAYHFTYPGFAFVRPWPGAWMYVHYGVLLVCALCVAAGCCYRLASLIFFLGFTYAELIDRSLYLNHYYLVTLLSGLLTVLPAERVFSLDAWRKPELARATVPRWVLSVLQLQVALVYVFAGVSKLNHDWLVEAQPLRMWLAARSDLPLVGPWLALPAVAHVASVAGCAFDLSIVGLLLARRTRPFACAALVVFHGLTAVLFPIGIFPWLMTASATLFLPPAWPRRMFARSVSPSSARPAVDPWRAPSWLGPLLAAHCLVQVLVPLRQHALGGDSAWTLDGFNFAWNVMVAEKAGAVSFRARERGSSVSERVEPRGFLARFQESAMAQDPELVREAALLVAHAFRQRGRDVAVYADAVASLNGRPARSLVDPNIDLTGPLPPRWILELE
jgi:vitamin K-dependent gamma-carboxylase